MIHLRINEILNERHMTQKELCKQSGLRPTTVSEMVRGIRSAVNLKHLDIIMETLDITDFNEILKRGGDNTNERT